MPLLGAAEAAGQGDFRTAGTQLLGAAASRLRGAGSPCGKGLGGALEKGLWAYNTAQRVAGIQEKLQSGDIVGATLDTLEAAVGVRRMLQACFVAGTPLRGEFGAQAIESFRVGIGSGAGTSTIRRVRAGCKWSRKCSFGWVGCCG